MTERMKVHKGRGDGRVCHWCHTEIEEGRRKKERTMAISEYRKEANIEIIGNCTRAIAKLLDQISYAEEAHSLKISGWKTRIDDCKAKISQLTTELEN